jgi:phage-related protein
VQAVVVEGVADPQVQRVRVGGGRHQRVAKSGELLDDALLAHDRDVTRAWRSDEVTAAIRRFLERLFGSATR